MTKSLICLGLSALACSAAVTVSTVDQLNAAIARANTDPAADREVLIEDGTYHLKWNSLAIDRPGMIIRGKSGTRERVILQGQNGMKGGKIEFIFQVRADDVTIRDLTLMDVGSHAVIIHGEAPYDADRTRLSNLVIRDTYEQMVKGTPSNQDPSKFYSEGGILEDSLLEYTAGIGPQFYIGGIDVHGGKDWIVRRNVFKNIISPSKSVAEHAVHFWSWSANTLVEDNVIINCDRAVGLGLSSSGHTQGVIRNNRVFHDETNRGGFADVSIEVLHSDGAAIYNNVVWQAHTNYFAAIKNFESKDVVISNNVVAMAPHSYWKLRQAIWVKDGTGSVSSNIISAPDPGLFLSATPPPIERVEDAKDFLRLRPQPRRLPPTSRRRN